MTRGPGWHFLDMGRRLERAMSTLTLLHSTCVAPSSDEGAVLEMVLEIADSSMTYRSRYLTTLQMIPVLDLLLTDDSNPRSVLYQLDVLAEHVAYLSRDTTQPALSQAQRLALMALMSLKLAELDTLCSRDANGQRAQLAGLLQQLRQYLPALAETITQQYLSHAEVSRHLAIRQQTSPA
jgi:uncharacterized alpha-E superfamily protein